MVRDETEAAERFLSAPLLADAGDGARRAVLDATREERAPAGTMLLAEGRPNDRLWFLIDGSATVQHRGPGGRAEAIATLPAPTVFGTTSFFTPKPPMFSVAAATDCRLLSLDHDAYERLRRENPHAAEALALAALRVLSERFVELDRMLTAAYSERPEDRPKVTEWAGFRARLFGEPEL